MLKERYEHDPFGRYLNFFSDYKQSTHDFFLFRQGAGAPILDEYGRIMTTRKKPAFQSYRSHHGMSSLDSGRFSTMATTVNGENIDQNLMPIKPHNPYINRINTSHTTLPEFAIKHQLNHELGPNPQMMGTQNGFSQPQQSYQQIPQNYPAQEQQDMMSQNMPSMTNRKFFVESLAN